jgi:peptide-methionine (S)-S-oxide reductase
MRLAPILFLSLLLAMLAPTALADPPAATDPAATSVPELRRSVFAGGCFWCMEPPFEALDGVIEVVSGYAGGELPNPTYEQVSSGRSGHIEVVEVTWDPSRVTYGRLLEVYWRNVDPTVANRQFCDVGPQYRSAIFVATPEERAEAEASRAAIAADPRFANRTIHTEILDAAPFWRAEYYHQDYATRNPVRYNWYRYNCGRDARLREIWGKGPKD